MTAKRKHHAPKTVDAKLDALRRALGVDMRRDKSASLRKQVAALHADVKRLTKLVERSLARPHTTSVSVRRPFYSVDDLARAVRNAARARTGTKRPSRIEREGWKFGSQQG